MAKVNPSSSTQVYLPISQIRDDVVVLKDGSLRGVIMVSSINFSLKSEEEQDAIVSSYVSFLNSLSFSLQVVIQSRRLNIDNYLTRINEQEKRLTNDLLRRQIQEYRAYIKELISLGDIMSKRFFVVVSFSPMESKKKSYRPGFFAQLRKAFKPGIEIKLKEQDFFSLREQLFKRVEYARSGLMSMGLNTVILDTQSLIELFYGAYNPEISDVEKLSEISSLRVE